jgi:hypothetical protein
LEVEPTGAEVDLVTVTIRMDGLGPVAATWIPIQSEFALQVRFISGAEEVEVCQKGLVSPKVAATVLTLS